MRACVNNNLVYHAPFLLHVRHGIPLGIMDKSLFKINVGGITPLPPSVPHEQWTVPGNGKAHYLEVEANKIPLKVSKGWSWPPPHMLELRGRTEARIHSFTEAKYSWNVATPGTYQPAPGPCRCTLLTCSGGLGQVCPSPW